MSRFVFIALVLAAGVAFCSSTEEESSDINKGKWIDQDTFQVTVKGSTNPELITRIERKNLARDDARTNAVNLINNIFLKERLKVSGADAKGDYYTVRASIRASIRSDLGKVIDNGTIEMEIFDKDDNCTIIYRIQKTGLKSVLLNYKFQK